jgi:hypothetical protein
MATDQVTFFGEPLRKQIEVYFVSAGREIHVSVSYGAVGPVIDYNSQILLVQKLLSELARDPSGDKFKELGKPGRRSVPRWRSCGAKSVIQRSSEKIATAGSTSVLDSRSNEQAGPSRTGRGARRPVMRWRPTTKEK